MRKEENHGEQKEESIVAIKNQTYIEMRREGYPLGGICSHDGTSSHIRHGEGDLTVVARRDRLGDGGTSLVGALHGEEGRPGSHHDDHQQAWTRLIHMAQPLTSGWAHVRRRKRHRERPGIGGGRTDGSDSRHAQEGGSYLARKAWRAEEVALAQGRSGGCLRRAWS
jgi:hypothetical protein